MSIEVIYRVLKSNGELAGEYMDKKEADAHDQKLDCIYVIAELVQEATSLSDEAAEKVAEHLVQKRADVMSALKKVKDTAPPKTVAEEGTLEVVASRAANG